MERARKLLGKRVRVTLDERGVVHEGILLGFGTDGEFELDDGMSIHYCWPLLDIEAVP